MLREFRVNGADAPSAMFQAAVELKTGMAVVKNYVDGTLELPSEATAEGLFLVQKAPILTGRDAALTDVSDYYEPLNTVEAEEFAVAYSYRDDSAFGTDQYDAASLTDDAAPCRVAAGTDGKWTKATGASKYLFVGLYNDAGHILAQIEVTEAGE